MASSSTFLKRSSALELVNFLAFLSNVPFLLVSPYPTSTSTSSSRKIYTVYTGETGNFWARSLGRSPSTNLPWSDLAATRARFTIDVEPDWSDVNLIGRVYNVWLYNFNYEDPHPADPSSTDEPSGSRQSNHINIEGPFRIQPHRYVDQIVLSINAYQPTWVQEQYSGKLLRTFEVIESPLFERPAFRLEQNTVGSEWISSKPAGLDSVILEYAIAWVMFCKIPDTQYNELEHDTWGVELIHLYLMLREDPDEVRRKHGQEIPSLEGPWVVTTQDETHRLVLFDGQDHPIWLSLHLKAYDDKYFRPGPNNDVVLPQFANFVVLAPEDRPASAVAESESESEAESEVILNAYKYTCMRSTIEYWVQPINTAQIHEFEVPRSKKVVIKTAVDTNDPRHKSMVGKSQRHYPLAQSIQVSMRDAQQDRVIALSEHTDQLSYDTRVKSDQEASHWIFAMICVLARIGSRTDTSMRLRSS